MGRVESVISLVGVPALRVTVADATVALGVPLFPFLGVEMQGWGALRPSSIGSFSFRVAKGIARLFAAHMSL